MRGRRGTYALQVPTHDPRGPQRILSGASLVLLLLASLLGSYLITSNFGTQIFVIVITAVFFGTLYAIISFRDLTVPFLVWILAIGGFRFLFSVQAPMLPDLFLDRMAMIWLSVVFLIKSVAERRRLRRPFILDAFLLTNAIYVFMSMYTTDLIAFNSWTMSYLVAYSSFFFAKSLIVTRKQVRAFLIVLLALSAYYNITSIAEKFHIDWIVWPKYILLANHFEGRSGGPFQHAPLFGTIIGMLLPIHLYFLATVRRPLAKVLLYLSFCLGFAGLYFTYTRGSWLAGIAALGVVAVLNRRQYLKILTPALVLVPILAIGFLGVKEDKFAQDRLENEDTFGSRLGTFVTATRVWRDNPIFGVGFYQYRFVLGDYIRPVEVPGMETIPVNLFRHNPPHDIYFGLLAETGLLGVFLQGSIYLLVLKAFLGNYRRRRFDDDFAHLVMPFFAGIFLGYLVGGLAIDYKFFSVVGTLFYACAGILYGYRPEDYHGRQAPQVAAPTPPSLQFFSGGGPSRSSQVE